MSFDVPAFVHAWVEKWHTILGLNGMHIHISILPLVNGDPDVRGECLQHTHLNLCELNFRHDIEETPEWETTVVHELLHAAHARIDALIESAIITALPEPAQAIALATYTQAYESYTHNLAVRLASFAQLTEEHAANR